MSDIWVRAALAQDDTEGKEVPELTSDQGEGKAEVYYLDLLSEKFIHSSHYYMNKNDIIVVPPLKQRPYQIDFGNNLTLVISSISLFVRILCIVDD